MLKGDISKIRAIQSQKNKGQLTPEGEDAFNKFKETE